MSSINDEYNYYDYEDVTTVSAIGQVGDAVTEVWTSSNLRDISDVMAKRVMLTFYTWIHRIIMGIGAILGLAVLVGIPVLLGIGMLIPKMREILRKRRFHVIQDRFRSRLELEQEKFDKKFEQERHRRHRRY